MCNSPFVIIFLIFLYIFILYLIFITYLETYLFEYRLYPNSFIHFILFYIYILFFLLCLQWPHKSQRKLSKIQFNKQK